MMHFREPQKRSLTWITALLMLSACGGKNSPSPSSNPTPSGGTSVATTSTGSPVQGTESSAGGGNAVVCFDDVAIADQVRAANGVIAQKFIDNNIVSIKMYDLFRAEEPRGRDNPVVPVLIAVKADETPAQYIERIAKRFDNAIPDLADVIRMGMQQFSDNSIHWSTLGLKTINDINSVETLPSGCVLSTMAAQTGTNNLSELTIDWRLYFHKKHSKLSQAVLLLHEVLYVMARKWEEHSDSRAVRRVVGYSIANIPRYTSNELLEILNESTSFTNPYFKSKSTLWLTGAIYEMMASLNTEIRLRFSVGNPERAVFDQFKQFLAKEKIECNPMTLNGCWAAFYTLSEERGNIAREKERPLLIQTDNARRKLDKELVQFLDQEWDKKYSLNEMKKFTWLAPKMAEEWYSAIKSELPEQLVFASSNISCENNDDKKCHSSIDNENAENVAHALIRIKSSVSDPNILVPISE